MISKFNKKRNITPKMTIKALKENNIDATEEEANEILDFLYFLAGLTVKDILKDLKNDNGD